MRIRLALMLVLSLGLGAASAAPAKRDPAPVAGLIAAIRAKDLAGVRACLASGVDPNALFQLSESEGDQVTPLLEAAWGGAVPIAEELLRRGAVADLAGRRGETPPW